MKIKTKKKPGLAHLKNESHKYQYQKLQTFLFWICLLKNMDNHNLEQNRLMTLIENFKLC